MKGNAVRPGGCQEGILPSNAFIFKLKFYCRKRRLEARRDSHLEDGDT